MRAINQPAMIPIHKFVPDIPEILKDGGVEPSDPDHRFTLALCNLGMLSLRDLPRLVIRRHLQVFLHHRHLGITVDIIQFE